MEKKGEEKAKREAKEEADRLAAQKAEEERAAQAKIESQLKAKEEADRLAAQKAEEEHVAQAKIESERKAKKEDSEVKATNHSREVVTPKIITSTSNKITLSNGMEFMRVPAGKFLMGSIYDNSDDKPQSLVDIPYDYWMARYPVTNAFYNAYAKSK
jgi:formylglycine-generating enzyme required for sulfatase activity